MKSLVILGTALLVGSLSASVMAESRHLEIGPGKEQKCLSLGSFAYTQALFRDFGGTEEEAKSNVDEDLSFRMQKDMHGVLSYVFSEEEPGPREAAYRVLLGCRTSEGAPQWEV